MSNQYQMTEIRHLSISNLNKSVQRIAPIKINSPGPLNQTGEFNFCRISQYNSTMRAKKDRNMINRTPIKIVSHKRKQNDILKEDQVVKDSRFSTS